MYILLSDDEKVHLARANGHWERGHISVAVVNKQLFLCNKIFFSFQQPYKD